MTRFFVSQTIHVSVIYSRRITLPNPGDFHDMVHQTYFYVINAKIYNKRARFYHRLLNSEYVCTYKPIYA
jgi:hypothetical protein